MEMEKGLEAEWIFHEENLSTGSQEQSAAVFAALISVGNLEPAVEQTRVTVTRGREKLLWVNKTWSNLQLFIWNIDKCQRAEILQTKMNDCNGRSKTSQSKIFPSFFCALMLCYVLAVGSLCLSRLDVFPTKECIVMKASKQILERVFHLFPSHFLFSEIFVGPSGNITSKITTRSIKGKANGEKRSKGENRFRLQLHWCKCMIISVKAEEF